MRVFRIKRLTGSAARLLATAALAIALGGVEARADHIFSLSGVTFDDGGTATGTFTTNDALNSLVSYDITTSGGTLAGFEYTPLTSISTPTSLPSILVVETASLDHILELTFSGLTAAGSPLTLGDNISFEQDPSGAHRLVTAGEVVAAAVPEPSSLLLGGLASLAGLGMWARRRRNG
jgi:PEP-CTERM motif